MEKNDKTLITTVSYEWSEEYFIQFATILSSSMTEKSLRWLPIAWNIIIALFMFLIGIPFYIGLGSFLLIIGIYYGWSEYKGKSVSAVYQSYKLAHELLLQFEFFDTYFVVSDKYGTNTYPYNILYSIKSSKYGYVLCVSKVSGFFIPKSACDKQLIILLEQMPPKKG